ncbi:MAG: NUDIX domain-containing protein [Flavobacteriales bacterium]|nr:NUDIX domain-containing protein [Flavobacteriales bacterium]
MINNKFGSVDHFLSENNLPFEDFFRFGLSVDCVIFGYHHGTLKVLLIQRGADPFKYQWAIPGDLVSPEEDLDSSAERILQHLTGLKDIYVEQFHTFGQRDRHPAGRVVTVGYFALVESEKYQPVASHWASDIGWFDIRNIPPLAFDHDDILAKGIEFLRKKVRTEPVVFNLLPPKFTLLDIQGLYEALLLEKFDKPNFRKKILSTGVLVPLDEVQTNVAHRPAKLFRFDQERYDTLKGNTINFEL